MIISQCECFGCLLVWRIQGCFDKMPRRENISDLKDALVVHHPTARQIKHSLQTLIFPGVDVPATLPQGAMLKESISDSAGLSPMLKFMAVLPLVNKVFSYSCRVAHRE